MLVSRETRLRLAGKLCVSSVTAATAVAAVLAGWWWCGCQLLWARAVARHWWRAPVWHASQEMRRQGCAASACRAGQPGARVRQQIAV